MAPRAKSSKGRGRTPRETPVETPEETPVETPEDETPRLFSQPTGEDTYYMVYRRDDITKKPIYQFRLAWHEVEEDHIQRLRGGGEYRIKEMVMDDRGAYVFGRQRTVFIDGPPKALESIPTGPVSKRRQAEGSGVAVPQPVKGGADIGDIMAAGILNLFQAQQGVQATVLEQVKAMNTQRESSVDWGKVMVALSPVLVKLLDRGPDKPPTDPLTTALEITRVMKDATSAPSTLKDNLEVMNEFLDIKDRVTGGTGDPVMDLATTFLPKLIEVVQEEQRRKGQEPTPTEELSTRLRQRLAPTGAPSPQGDDPVWRKLLAQRLGVLLKMAAAGKDPEVIADYEFELLPEQFRGAVREWIAREDVMQQVAQMAPGAAQYPQWVQTFLSRLYELFYPPEEVQGADVVEVPGEQRPGEETLEQEEDSNVAREE